MLIELSEAEISHHLAMMTKSREVRARLWNPPVPAPEPEPVMLRHIIDATRYEVPIGPVFVPKDAPQGYNPNRPRSSPRAIIAEVARLARISVDDMKGRRRTVVYVRPRQFAMWRIHKECAPRSLPQIGRDFGGRDHTTAINAIRKVESAIASGALNPDDPVGWFRSPYGAARVR